ncbi:hypothetical protein [Kordia jejudonensis]|uniref:hypothetical protein n=1 Tax=Kordia jejudonensis TaxID=1348245 RepID=UPI0006293FE7|nr:hypothetical protein [Kordia jejudonensis]
MKKYLTIFLIIFCLYLTTAQPIQIKNDIAYVDDKPYLKIQKQSNKLLFLYDVKTNEELLKVTIQGKKNRREKKYDYKTKFYFFKIKKKLNFSNIVVNDEKELIYFLYSHQLFLPGKTWTKAEILKQYESLQNKSKCHNTPENSFSEYIYDDFISIVNKDTLRFNEVKYKCVQSSYYIQKIMYDRFGKWHKAILQSTDANGPSLIWNNVKLLKNVDEKFTIIARGFEGEHQYRYTSMMIFDAKGKDMLAENAPYRFTFVELFGYYINENYASNDFYEVYRKTFNPERWREIESYRRNKN